MIAWGPKLVGKRVPVHTPLTDYFSIGMVEALNSPMKKIPGVAESLFIYFFFFLKEYNYRYGTAMYIFQVSN